MLPENLRMETPTAGADEKWTVSQGDVRITVLTSRLIRLEQGGREDGATLVALNRRFDTPDFRAETLENEIRIETEDLQVVCRTDVPFSAESLSITGLRKPYFRWRYGDRPLQNLGGTASTLDGVNGACEIGDGVCSVDGYALLDDSGTPRMTEDGWFAPAPEGRTDLYFFGYGHDYVSAVRDYQRLTGTPGMLPAYTLGNWWSRYHAYTQEEYLALVDQFRDRDVPFSVCIIDMDWHLTDGDGREYWKDGWTGYTWNRELFPDYREFLRQLHARGVYTALNEHPHSGVRPWDEMYPEMKRALGLPEDGKPVSFDCLSPEFWKAYFEVLHDPYERDGVDFWWLDWQQGNDYWWIHENGGEKRELEDHLGPLWLLNHMHYLHSRRDGRRGFVFSRFAGPGSQRYPLGFSGDTVISWDSLRFQPYFTATASNIGYGWWSHDIGGHMGGHKDDELTVRWVQLGVFSPIMRLHSTSSPFTTREPWSSEPRAAAVIIDFLRLRHRLFPYLYAMNERAARELRPLVQPMYYSHPDVREAYQVPNQYWFGSEMIVSPVTNPADPVSGLGGTEVWLPEGEWTDFFTGMIYRGGRKLRVYRPLETMPVFLKAGAVVPMKPHVPGSNELGFGEEIELIAAPGADGRFELYEDDGITENGPCRRTEITWAWTERRGVLTIHPARGDAENLPAVRNYTIRFRGFRPDAVCGGDGTYDPETNTWTVRLEGVAADTGASAEIRHEECLTFDNRTWEARILDLLVHGQCTLEEKNELLRRVKECEKRGEADPGPLASDDGDRLADAALEILSQVFPPVIYPRNK